MTQTASKNRNSSRSSSSRGGQRRRSGGNNRSGRPRNSSPRKPQKKSFFQKLLGFFGIGNDDNRGTGRPKSVKRVSGSPKSSGGKSDRGERPARTRRKPEIVPVETPRLYLGNLSYDASEQDLMDLFGGVGTVQEVEIITHRRTQRSKGYAFLEMTTVEEAQRAVDQLHDQDFMGRKLVVSGAKDRGSENNSRDDRDSRDDAQDDSPTTDVEL